VHAMGGEITVDSAPGRGSRFRFTARLGRAAQDAPATAADARGLVPAGAQPGGRHLRVLLAEDNAVNQKLAQAMLQKLGHAVTIADDGARAVELVARHTFDLVLMDMQMPRLDGLEATRLIRAAGHALPIVAMTANAMDSDRQRCLDAGMDDFLAKPVRTRELAEVIARQPAGPAELAEH
jgi:CheY-like chemotaxis protein